MDFWAKVRSPGARHASMMPSSRGGTGAAAAGSHGVSSAPARAAHPSGNLRVSNGLKEFLWNLDGLGHGSLLDLGPVWQSTITFFVERGFKVYADDLLRDWKQFVTAEDERLRKIQPGEDASEMTPESRADRFLQSHIKYPRDNFDAILLWDQDRKSTRLNSSHGYISYAVFCLKKKKRNTTQSIKHDSRQLRTRPPATQ